MLSLTEIYQIDEAWKARKAYPGLGIPLIWQCESWQRSVFPTLTLPQSISSDQPRSEILPVREVAMMALMDKLTDKVDWHRKVFDVEIVTKWRQEALAAPDEYWWQIATRMEVDQHRIDQASSPLTWPEYTICPLRNIMNEEAFDYVSDISIY